MSFSSASIEFIYMAASPPCRAVWMCIKELGIEVDMRHIDMYKKAEHTQPWFVKVIDSFRKTSKCIFRLALLFYIGVLDGSPADLLA